MSKFLLSHTSVKKTVKIVGAARILVLNRLIAEVGIGRKIVAFKENGSRL